MVGLGREALGRYPHEFSGGQRQRICIARAVAVKPQLLICDEAVSALDLSVRSQVLELIKDLKERLGLSVLFITHDIGVVQYVSGRVLVMNRGRIVEQGDCDKVLADPAEEYTRRLIASVPTIGNVV
jgi:peptide/nickel transport system ATP-binding protein